MWVSVYKQIKTMNLSQVPVKNLDLHRFSAFLIKFMWFTLNNFANKLCILLSVADFAKHAKFVFSWTVWVVYGFALATKGKIKHMAISHYHQARNHGGKRQRRSRSWKNEQKLELEPCYKKRALEREPCCSWKEELRSWGSVIFTTAPYMYNTYSISHTILLDVLSVPTCSDTSAQWRNKGGPRAALSGERHCTD